MWISEKKYYAMLEMLAKCEARIAMLENRVGYPIQRGNTNSYSQMSFFYAPLADVVGQIIKHLGLRLAYHGGTPETAKLEDDVKP